MNIPGRNPMPQAEGDEFFTGFMCGLGTSGIIFSLLLFFL